MKKILLTICLLQFFVQGFSQTQVPAGSASPIYFKERNVGIGTNTPTNPLQINSDISIGKSLLFGLNENRLSDAVGSCSANLFILQTRLDAVLGLHSYVYRHSKSQHWANGTVRLSSCADGHGYPQDHHYNNMNWIDFVGNAGGINFGIGKGASILSIKNNKVLVNGTIRASEIKVEAQTADFVFEPDYKLRPLNEVEAFVKNNKHLPEIPSAKQMEAHGVNVAEMNKLLLQKIEELTLYLIEMKKDVTKLKKENTY